MSKNLEHKQFGPDVPNTVSGRLFYNIFKEDRCITYLDSNTKLDILLGPEWNGSYKPAIELTYNFFTIDYHASIIKILREETFSNQQIRDYLKANRVYDYENGVYIYKELVCTNYRDLSNYISEILLRSDEHFYTFVKMADINPKHICEIISYLSFIFTSNYTEAVHFIIQMGTNNLQDFYNFYYQIINTYYCSLCSSKSSIITTNSFVVRYTSGPFSVKDDVKEKVYASYDRWRSWGPETFSDVKPIVTAIIWSLRTCYNYFNSSKALTPPSIDKSLSNNEESFQMFKFFSGIGAQKLGQLAGHIGIKFFSGVLESVNKK